MSAINSFSLICFNQIKLPSFYVLFIIYQIIIIVLEMNSIIDQIHYNTLNTHCCLFINQIATEPAPNPPHHHSQPKNTTYHPPRGILVTKRSRSTQKAHRLASQYSSEKELKTNSESTKILITIGSKACSRKNSSS